MFMNSRVKRLTPRVISGIGKYRFNSYTRIVLACTETKLNCKKHELIFEKMAVKLKGMIQLGRVYVLVYSI